MREALWPSGEVDHDAETRLFFEEPDERDRTFVAERDGILVGFLELGWRNYAEQCTTTPVAYVEGWYVDEDARRDGVGTALLEVAEGWARSAGYRELASDAELGNEEGIEVHRALGFEETDRIVCFRRVL